MNRTSFNNMDFEIKKAFKEIEKEALSKFDSESVYNQVLKRIQREDMEFDRFLRFFRNLFSSPNIAWGVVVVELVVILGLLFYNDTFKTLCGNYFVDKGVEINIVFDESAKEKDIRALLNRLNAQIIRGPTPEGLYVIEVLSKNFSSQEIIDILRSSGIVKFAKPRYPYHRSRTDEKRLSFNFHYG